MSISPNTYLLSLAGLAISFVGFSALVVTLRQTAGGAVSRLDAFLMRTFIQLGFIVAAGALIAPLLDLANLPEPLIWRIASAAVGVPALAFALTYPHRRRRASRQKTPLVIWLDVAVLSLAGSALLLNATGSMFASGPFALAAGLTVILCLSGWAYLQALQLLLKQHLSVARGG